MKMRWGLLGLLAKKSRRDASGPRGVKMRWGLLGLLAFLLPLNAFAQSEGTIRGTVIQGTAGGGSTAGLEIVLRSLDSDQVPLRQATTGAEGEFEFVGLSVGEGATYLLQVTYAGVVYSSGPVSWTADQDTMTVDLNVYETTDDESTIYIQRAHIFVTPSEADLLVTELYVFANLGDRTYVGQAQVQDRLWTSRFSLPPSSRDLALEDGVLGGRFLPLEGGFVDTEPYWPGTTSVLFAYRVDCPGGSCDLSRPVWQPVADLNVLVPDVDVALTGDAAFTGRREAQGMTYLNYTAQGLQAGERLDLRLDRRDAALQRLYDGAGTTAPALPWIILITVLAVLPLAYPFWRQRIQSSARQDR